MIRLMARALTAFFMAIAVLAAIYTTLLLGPRAERWIAGPVVSKFKVLSATMTQEGRTVVFVELTKYRECDFVSLSWYHEPDDSSFIRVPVKLVEVDEISDQTRPVGPQRAGPWVVYMPPDDLLRHSFAKVHHRCHGLWTTITDVYP